MPILHPGFTGSGRLARGWKCAGWPEGSARQLGWQLSGWFNAFRSNQGEKHMPSELDASPPVVSRREWLEARQELLAREKQLTRQYDAVAAARRALPRVRVAEDYLFDGPEGKVTLADLFANRSQLIIRHFMFAPGWREGCVGCSFLADHIDGARIHLEQHDVSLVAVSRAPYAEINAFQKRMGWQFRWVSAYANDFNYDYHLSGPMKSRAAGFITISNYAQPSVKSAPASVSSPEMPRAVSSTPTRPTGEATNSW